MPILDLRNKIVFENAEKLINNSLCMTFWSGLECT